LNNSYESLKSAYSGSNKKNINKAYNRGVIVKKCNLEECISFIKNEYLKILKNIPVQAFDMYYELMKLTEKNGKIYCMGAYYDNVLVAAISLLIKSNRIHTLPIASEEGKHLSALFLLIDKLIEEHSETNQTIDFGGSDIESIAYFFGGFGSIKENYYQIKYSYLLPRFIL
jgi:hypothetical protein